MCAEPADPAFADPVDASNNCPDGELVCALLLLTVVDLWRVGNAARKPRLRALTVWAREVEPGTEETERRPWQLRRPLAWTARQWSGLI
jgi:hypothetical protein